MGCCEERMKPNPDTEVKVEELMRASNDIDFYARTERAETLMTEQSELKLSERKEKMQSADGDPKGDGQKEEKSPDKGDESPT